MFVSLQIPFFVPFSSSHTDFEQLTMLTPFSFLYRISLRHAIYRAASAASGSTARSFIAKPQAANSQLSQITRVLGSQLWASQRRLFTDEARDAVSEERKPFVRPISKRSFGLPPTRPSPEPKSTVYVGNILFDITAADLKEYASKYGKVVGSRIIYDSRGLSRGYAILPYFFFYIVFLSLANLRLSDSVMSNLRISRKLKRLSTTCILANLKAAN